jgi:hypothetical protein
MAWTVGDYSTSWLALGKIWRQACSYGFNQLDAEPTEKRGLFLAPLPLNIGEKDELRRVLWSLLFLDRDQCWATGWPHAIANRQFLVTFHFSGCTRTLNYQQLHTVSLQLPIPPPFFFLLLHYLRLAGKRFSCLVCSDTLVKPLGSPEGVYRFLPLYTARTASTIVSEFSLTT